MHPIFFYLYPHNLKYEILVFSENLLVIRFLMMNYTIQLCWIGTIKF